MNASTDADGRDASHGSVSSDPYLLRDLLWCGLCSLPLVTVLLSTGKRAYGCTNAHCARPLLDAEATEQSVWQRFALLNEAAASTVQRNERQAALRRALRRVTVHSSPNELALAWRD